MKNTKDLNWLSAPAFFLILGMIFLSAKKQMRATSPKGKINMENTVPQVQKQ